MKNTYFGLMAIAICLVMPVGVQGATLEDLSQTTQLQTQITQLQQAFDELQERIRVVRATMLVSLAQESDEGMLPVTLSERMRFACKDKVITDGEWCVRSDTSDLGVSYVDVSTIVGFAYDERYSYDLSLLKTRSESFGEDGAIQYDYTLVSVDNRI